MDPSLPLISAEMRDVHALEKAVHDLHEAGEELQVLKAQIDILNRPHEASEVDLSRIRKASAIIGGVIPQINAIYRLAVQKESRKMKAEALNAYQLLTIVRNEVEVLNRGLKEHRVDDLDKTDKQFNKAVKIFKQSTLFPESRLKELKSLFKELQKGPVDPEKMEDLNNQLFLFIQEQRSNPILQKKGIKLFKQVEASIRSHSPKMAARLVDYPHINPSDPKSKLVGREAIVKDPPTNLFGFILSQPAKEEKKHWFNLGESALERKQVEKLMNASTVYFEEEVHPIDNSHVPSGYLISHEVLLTHKANGRGRDNIETPFKVYMEEIPAPDRSSFPDEMKGALTRFLKVCDKDQIDVPVIPLAALLENVPPKLREKEEPVIIDALNEVLRHNRFNFEYVIVSDYKQDPSKIPHNDNVFLLKNPSLQIVEWGVDEKKKMGLLCTRGVQNPELGGKSFEERLKASSTLFLSASDFNPKIGQQKDYVQL